MCNKHSCADVQISITIRIQALRDVFIQTVFSTEAAGNYSPSLDNPFSL